MNKIDFENATIQELRKELINQSNKIFDLQEKLDLANIELATYRKSMKELAKRNLEVMAEKKNANVEIPARDLVDIMESELNEAFNDDKLMDCLSGTDLTVSWNGFSSSLIWGAWIYNSGILDAIKDCYEEINE